MAFNRTACRRRRSDQTAEELDVKFATRSSNVNISRPSGMLQPLQRQEVQQRFRQKPSSTRTRAAGPAGFLRVADLRAVRFRSKRQQRANSGPARFRNRLQQERFGIELIQSSPRKEGGVMPFMVVDHTARG